MSEAYLKQLHEKIRDFSEKAEITHKGHIQCKSGCYRCCLVDLSVFEVEANFIRNWFHRLSIEEKNELKNRWKNNKTIQEENFHGQAASPCKFLVKGNCSVYEARPVICRTQGLPLLFKNDDSFLFDSCPLNFTDSRPISKDCLNLDQLNLMLAQIENLDAAGKSRPRVVLTQLIDELLES